MDNRAETMDKKLDSSCGEPKDGCFASLSASIESLVYAFKEKNLIDSNDCKFVISKLDKF
jgi:hypothetical protein